MRALLLFAPLLLAAHAAAVASEMRFGLPIACEPERDCWLQNHADRDAGPGVLDYACGAQSYDGHDGTDIRVRDTAATADILASAAGIVKAIRDGEADNLVKTHADRAAVANRECGNGVLIVHDGGWETQYCHMKRGSVAVKPGQRVEAGERLGSVGYSGMAAFPHVHLAIRKAGQALDPFAPDATLACGTAQAPLWTDEAAHALVYRRGSLLRSGFVPGKVTVEDLEAGGTGIADAGSPNLSWPAIVAYGWAINLEKGDEIIVRLDGPGDYDAENRMALDRPKAQFLLFAGRPGPEARGTYSGSFTVLRHGQAVIERHWSAELF